MNKKNYSFKIISFILIKTFLVTAIGWSGEIKINHANTEYLSPKITISIDTLRNAFQSNFNTKPLEKEKISDQRESFLQKERRLFIKKMLVVVPLFLVSLSAIGVSFVFFYKFLVTLPVPISTFSADYVKSHSKTFIGILLSIMGLYYGGNLSQELLRFFENSFSLYLVERSI